MDYIRTRALVLLQTRYSDDYGIAHLYTEQAGGVSILVPLAKGRKGGSRQLLQPLVELEVVLAPRRHGDIYRVREIRCLEPRHLIAMDQVKSAQRIFLAEFLDRTLRTPQPDAQLYSFISLAIGQWETQHRGVANFHLWFLMNLLPYLGIAPDITEPPAGGEYYLDLRDLSYRTEGNDLCLQPEEVRYLPLLMRMSLGNMHLYRLNHLQRRLILDRLLTYYRLHYHNFPRLKCLDLLQAWSDNAARESLSVDEGGSSPTIPTT